MKAKITKTLVDRSIPKTKRYDIQCTTLPGFVLRVSTSGVKSFGVRYRAGGRDKRVSLGRYGEHYTVKQARDAAKKLLGQIQAGTYEGRRRRERASVTFAELANKYLTEYAEVALKPRTLESYKGLLRLHILPRLGTTPLEELRNFHARNLHREISSEHPEVANRALSVLSGVFRFAEDCGLFMGRAEVLRGIRKNREKSKERFLSEAERGRLDQVLRQAPRRRRNEEGHATQGAVDAIRLLLLTGLRLSEVLNLQWGMVDFEHGVLRLPDTKTGPRVVQLSARALDYLEGVRRRRAPSLFVTPSGRGARIQNLQRTWTRLRREAGLEDVRLHDIRHSYASDAVMSGVPLQAVSKLLGHKSTRTTERYAHLSNAYVRECVEQVDATIAKAESTQG